MAATGHAHGLCSSDRAPNGFNRLLLEGWPEELGWFEGLVAPPIPPFHVIAAIDHWRAPRWGRATPYRSAASVLDIEVASPHHVVDYRLPITRSQLRFPDPN